MLLVYLSCLKNIELLDFLSSDHRLLHYPLMRTPFQMTSILLGYVFFSLYAGPRLMLHRKPYHLKTAMIIYNFSMVSLNTFLVYEVSKAVNYSGEWKFLKEPCCEDILYCSKTFPSVYELMMWQRVLCFAFAVPDVRMGNHFYLEMWPVWLLKQPTGSKGISVLFFPMRESVLHHEMYVLLYIQICICDLFFYSVLFIVCTCFSFCQMVQVAWWFLFSKFTELLDTVRMISLSEHHVCE